MIFRLLDHRKRPIAEYNTDTDCVSLHMYVQPVEIALEFEDINRALYKIDRDGERYARGFDELFGTIGKLEAFKNWPDIYSRDPSVRDDLSRVSIRECDYWIRGSNGVKYDCLGSPLSRHQFS